MFFLAGSKNLGPTSAYFVLLRPMTALSLLLFLVASLLLLVMPGAPGSVLVHAVARARV